MPKLPNIRTLGLFWFVCTIAVAIAALVLDVGLMLCGFTMITTESRAHPLFGWVIIAFLLSGSAGLAVHFLRYPDQDDQS